MKVAKDRERLDTRTFLLQPKSGQWVEWSSGRRNTLDISQQLWECQPTTTNTARIWTTEAD